MGRQASGSASNETGEQYKELKIDIPEELRFPKFPHCCIYKVPPMLRNINKSAYTPQLVSIGPFQKKLVNGGMEKQKLKYFKEFLENRTKKTQEDLFKQIEGWKDKIDRCYEDYSSSPREVYFMRTILLDSVFIIELFLKSETDKGFRTDDFMLNRPLVKQTIDRDLILLENQMPYFVLDELYNFALDKPRYSFLELSCRRFQHFLQPPQAKKNRKGYSSCFFRCKPSLCCENLMARTEDENFNKFIKKVQDRHIMHFTDLIRKLLSQNAPEIKANSGCVTDLYSATKMHEAGVKFKVEDKKWPIEIEFQGKYLIMPPTMFDDHTECLIRNLIAFEQCHFPGEAHISNYMLVLDYLIDKENDVDLLTSSGIIINMLGSQKTVAKVVNSLCLEISAMDSGYVNLSKELNEHCDSCWHRTLAILRRVYFSNLWRGTGTIAALILLVLTLMQTLTSIYSIKSIFA